MLHLLKKNTLTVLAALKMSLISAIYDGSIAARNSFLDIIEALAATGGISSVVKVSLIALLILYNFVQVGFRLLVFSGLSNRRRNLFAITIVDLVKLSNFAQMMIALMLGCSGAIFVGASSRSAVSIDGPLEVFLCKPGAAFSVRSASKAGCDALALLYGIGTIIVVYLLDLWVPLT